MYIKEKREENKKKMFFFDRLYHMAPQAQTNTQ
jgi:hypothetical protein